LKKKSLLFAFAFLVPLAGCGCGRDGEGEIAPHPAGPSARAEAPLAPAVVRAPFETMGTTGAVTVALGQLDEAAAQAAAGRAVAAAKRVSARMSAYDPESEVGRFNRLAAGEAMTLSPDTARVLALALETWRTSEGRFDVTVGPLVQIYRPLVRQYQLDGVEVALPPDARVAEARARVGSGHLVFDTKRRTLAKRVEGVRIDLGAVAKGFGVDAAVEALRAAGVRRALVEIGGEVRALGEKAPGVPWRVAVRNPRGEGSIVTLDLADRAVATSGDYAQFFVSGGVRYSHIVDPRTGRPVRRGIVSATVLARDCARADALATSLCAWGGEGGLKGMLAALGAGDLEALVVREAADGALSVERTEGLKKLEVNLARDAE